MLSANAKRLGETRQAVALDARAADPFADTLPPAPARGDRARSSTLPPPRESGVTRPGAMSLLDRLVDLTVVLGEATAVADIARATIEQAAAALGAHAAAVWALDGQTGAPALLDAISPPEEAKRAFNTFASACAPALDAMRSAEVLWLEDRAACASRYPALPIVFFGAGAELSLVCAPIRIGRRTVGCLQLLFHRATCPDRETLDFLLLVSRDAGLALDRARAHEDAERALSDAARARRAAAQAQAEAQQAIRLRDDFLGIAGHELKTPLTALQLGIQSLAKQIGDNATALKRVGACQRQLERLNKLTGELLDVSRINAQRLTLDLDWMDLAPLVHEVTGRMGDDLSRAGCALSLAVAGSVVGRWDRARLEQILVNLLANAAKYGKGKPVEVSLEATEAGARLSVRDHGIGIAPADQARIFERFERAVSERNYGGLGLGLFIVRRIVESLGGTIRLYSELGEGSTFTVELPRTLPSSREEPGWAGG